MSTMLDPRYWRLCKRLGGETHCNNMVRESREVHDLSTLNRSVGSFVSRAFSSSLFGESPDALFMSTGVFCLLRTVCLAICVVRCMESTAYSALHLFARAVFCCISCETDI